METLSLAFGSFLFFLPQNSSAQAPPPDSNPELSARAIRKEPLSRCGCAGMATQSAGTTFQTSRCWPYSLFSGGLRRPVFPIFVLAAKHRRSSAVSLFVGAFPFVKRSVDRRPSCLFLAAHFCPDPGSHLLHHGELHRLFYSAFPPLRPFPRPPFVR